MRIILSAFLLAVLFAANCRAGDAAAAGKDIVPANIAETAGLVRDLYNQAEAEYDAGNLRGAKRTYQKALEQLSAAELDPNISHQLKDDFDSILEKICSLSMSSQRRNETVSREIERQKYSIFTNTEDEATREYIKFFSLNGGKKRLEESLSRAGRYKDTVTGILKEFNLPQELFYLPVIESYYKVKARSPAGAVGIWQLMPSTARNYGLAVNFWIDERKDPVKATYAAARYLKSLDLLFNDWHLALAAYNRGEEGIRRDLNFSRASTFGELENRKAIPKETADFIPKFIACAFVAENPEEFGLSVTPEEPSAYEEIVLEKAVELRIAAQCAGTTVTELRDLNPGISQWCTPPNYPGYTLKIPQGSAENFRKAFANIKDTNPSTDCVRHKIKQGDTMEKIARKYFTTIANIRDMNMIKKLSLLTPGKILVIQPGREYFLH